MKNSKKPSEMPANPMLIHNDRNSQLAQFIAVNQQAFTQLLTFIDFSQNLTIGFVEVNFNAEADFLIESLKNHPISEENQFEVLSFGEDLRFLRDEIVKILPTIKREANKELVLIVRGLEKSIGKFGEYPPVLQDLNFVRDAYKTSVPYPILFVLPDYAITRLAKFAPDFWAWKSGVFLFKTTQSTRDDAVARTIDSERSFRTLKTPEKQERIELLESLLMDYSPSHSGTEKNPSACSNILHQLGVAYLSQGNPVKAREYLEPALKLTKESGNVSLQAEVYNELGKAYEQERQFLAAMSAYQASLEIAQKLGNRRGEANTLYDLGNVCQDLRDWQQATVFYQQCLEIEQAIGDIYSQASTYQQLGWVAKEMWNLTEAERYYRKALEIFSEYDDRSGMAYSWGVLGDIQRNRGNWDEAERLYRQSLELKTELGDRSGIAYSWGGLGDIERNRGNWDEAERLYGQCLEIMTELGDRSAIAASIGCLGENELGRGNLDAAETLLQEALAKIQELGMTWHIAETNYDLARLERQRNNPELAQQYYNTAHQIFQQLGAAKDLEKIEREWLNPDF
ncbi:MULTISPECIES: tetratricopeptide repeat protein [unclassified Microcoleus]|uniref:tetratricopeptide repeat protein n=1 Tax=unclassified Microcoleus TaxID=2642155 RepID=UPI0025EC9620|nr:MULTISPECIES: tetratricopeptide repeat protein [unclassified Microcoleus]